MCVGVPGRVVEAPQEPGGMAVVDCHGIRRRVSMAVIPDVAVEPGDWVDVYMGLALERITEQEAEEALELMRALGPPELTASGDGEERWP